MKVNTLIIGAGRSGTTTLYELLANHPNVCFSKIKEVHYFSIEDLYKKRENYYHSFFPHFKNEKIIASADTYLLMDYDAIKRIKAYNPTMKIIVILRNPVDRAYSSYNYSINYGYHQPYNFFLDSIIKENKIAEDKNIVQRNNLGHFYGSLYYKHLSEWLKEFPKENFLLLTISQLNNDLDVLKNRLVNFLLIEQFAESTEHKAEKLNSFSVPKLKAFEQFLLNRDNSLRRCIRWIVPSFLKRWIIHSNIVDKIHDLNRRSSNYKLLDEKDRKIAMKYFEHDLEALRSYFGIGL